MNPLPLAALAVVAVPSFASAVAVDLALDPAADGVNRATFTVSSVFPVVGTLSADGQSDASGTLAADVGLDGLLPDSFTFLAGTDVGFSDVTLSANVLGVPQVLAETRDVRGTITGGPFVVDPDGSVDLGGSVLTLDEGFVGLLGDDPAGNDLSGNPIVLTLPAGTAATLTATDLGDGTLGLVLDGDLAFSGQVDGDPAVTLDVTGGLLARGVVAIPEPATVGLAAVGGLLLTRRRR